MKKLTTTLVLAGALIAAAGCAHRTSSERAMDDFEDAADDVGDAIEEAADDVEDAFDD